MNTNSMRILFIGIYNALIWSLAGARLLFSVIQNFFLIRIKRGGSNPGFTMFHPGYNYAISLTEVVDTFGKSMTVPAI